MNSLSDIEKRALSTFSYGERLHPVRDWLVLLAVAVGLLGASVGANVLIYTSVKNSAVSSMTSTSAPASDTSAVTAAEAVFKTRAAEMQNYEKVYQFVDPSK